MNNTTMYPIKSLMPQQVMSPASALSPTHLTTLPAIKRPGVKPGGKAVKNRRNGKEVESFCKSSLPPNLFAFSLSFSSPLEETASRQQKIKAKSNLFAFFNLQTKISLPRLPSIMSDKREAQDKPLIILRDAEDYPDWKSYTISKLQQQNCAWAVKGKPEPNLQSIRTSLIADGFAANDLKTATLVSALRNEKKEYTLALTKSAGIIKELVDKSLHPLLNDKSSAEMWTILKDRFQHISPMTVTRVFSDACNVKLSDCRNIIDYTSRYQIAYDKILSLIGENSTWISKKTVELTLQGNLLRHLGKDYSALVTTIETEWKEETTSLSDTVLRVVRHAEINKGNERDMVSSASVNALAVGAQRERAPRGTCTNQECIDRGSTAHYNDRCWIRHPELRAKYALKHMKTRGSNRNLKKAADEPESREASTKQTASAAGTPEINS